MRKGIATQTIFMIVIGLAVVGLITVLVVRNVGTASEESQCSNAQNSYCRDWSLTGYDTDRDPGWENYQSSNSCSMPTDVSAREQRCRDLGYR